MPLDAAHILPMDAVPFSVAQEARLRRLCDEFIVQALQAVTRVEDRVAFFQLLKDIPDELVDGMTDEELAIAVDRKAKKVFDFGQLHKRLHIAWQGFGLIVDALVPTTKRRQVVRHWFELALIVADGRAKQPN